MANCEQLLAASSTGANPPTESKTGGLTFGPAGPGSQWGVLLSGGSYFWVTPLCCHFTCPKTETFHGTENSCGHRGGGVFLLRGLTFGGVLLLGAGLIWDGGFTSTANSSINAQALRERYKKGTKISSLNDSFEPLPQFHLHGINLATWAPPCLRFCNLWPNPGNYTGGILVQENFCPEKFSAGKIPPQSLKVMGKMAPHFSMVKGKA